MTHPPVIVPWPDGRPPAPVLIPPAFNAPKLRFVVEPLRDISRAPWADPSWVLDPEVPIGDAPLIGLRLVLLVDFEVAKPVASGLNGDSGEVYYLFQLNHLAAFATLPTQAILQELSSQYGVPFVWFDQEPNGQENAA